MQKYKARRLGLPWVRGLRSSPPHWEFRGQDFVWRRGMFEAASKHDPALLHSQHRQRAAQTRASARALRDH